MRVELQIKYFDHDDLPYLNDWLVARGKPRVEISELPSIGFTVSDGDFRIATCFLRRCEGNYGIVDGLCSNPEASSELRHHALDLAIRMTCEEARQREITNLVAWSVDGGTIARSCQRHGFKQAPHVLLTKSLGRIDNLQ